MLTSCIFLSVVHNILESALPLCHNVAVIMARRKRNTFFRKQGMFSAGTRGRKILTWTLAVIAALTLLCIIGFYQVLNWLQGDSFRKQMEDILTNHAQAAKVSIPHNLSIDDERISLPAVTVQRIDAFRNISASRIMATIDRGQLYSRRLIVRKLTLEEASLQLDAAGIGAKLPPIEKNNDGFWSRFAPDTVELKSLECADTDAALSLNGETYNIQGCSISAAPHRNGRENDWHLTLENGRVHTPLSYLQNCSIKTATLLYTPKATILSECRMMLSPGELRAQGSYQNSDGKWYADLQANKANIARLLNQDWKKRLYGELYGNIKLVGTGNTLKKASGQISLQQGLLEGLPILSQIQLDNTLPYRSIRLEKAECRISYPYTLARHNIRNAWLFDNIDLRARNGMLRILGHVIVAADGALRGTLTIGLPETVVEQLFSVRPEAAAAIFNTKGDAGYRWVNVNLSGTTSAPQEDLSARLSTILATHAADAALNATGKAAETMGEVIGGFLSRSGNRQTEADSQEEPPEPADAESTTPLPSPTDVLDILF